MPEDRDIRRPKTPPAGVRAQTAPESWEEPQHATRPGEPSEDVLLRRTKHISEAVLGVPERLVALEAGLEDQGKKLATQDGKLDMLITLGEASAIEREKRRRHDAEQAELKRQLALRTAQARGRAKVIAAVLGFIGAIVAAYLGSR